jgi:hypothetical protein
MKEGFQEEMDKFWIASQCAVFWIFPLGSEVKQALQMLATCIFSIPESSACITSFLPIVRNLNLPWKFDASSPQTLTLTLANTKKMTKFKKKKLSLVNFPRIPCVAFVLHSR